MARYPQPPERTNDGLVRPLLEVFAPPLHLISQIGRHVEGLAHVIEQRLTALLDGLTPCIHQACGAMLLLGEDDLREDHLRQVMAVVAIDHLDLVSFPHEISDALERHVVAPPPLPQPPPSLTLPNLPSYRLPS